MRKNMESVRNSSIHRLKLRFIILIISQSTPLTAEGVANRLKTMLRKAGLKPPYILVGHSDGGLFVQMFARLYPNQTAAVVLVDSASQDHTLNAPTPL